MVTCTCGKQMDKVPMWMEGINVQFVCNNCPNRTLKAITQVSFETPKDPNSEESAEEMLAAEDADDEDD